MPACHTLVQDVVAVGGTMVHVQGVDVLKTAENTDPLTGLLITACRGVNYGTQKAYEWDRDRNLL